MKLSDLNHKPNTQWDVDTTNFEFKKCSEMPQNENIPIYGLFITKDRGYGKGCVAILEHCFLTLPQRMVEDVEEYLQHDEVVEDIKANKWAVNIQEFFSEKYKRKGYDVLFVELD